MVCSFPFFCGVYWQGAANCRLKAPKNWPKTSIKYGFCATSANYLGGHVPGGVYRVPLLNRAYFQHFQTVKLPPNKQPPADPDAQSVKIPDQHCGEFTF